MVASYRFSVRASTDARSKAGIRAPFSRKSISYLLDKIPLMSKQAVAAIAVILAVALPQARAQQSAPPAGLPTPDSVFGFAPGADYKLATYDQSIAYFKALAAASPYIKLFEAGKTTQGRTIYFSLISTPANLANIDRYRVIWQRLAHPQGLTDDEAQRLAAEGKALVHIDGGLHATEVAGPQHTPLLAYDLLRKVEEPATHAMLDNEIGRAHV